MEPHILDLLRRCDYDIPLATSELLAVQSAYQGSEMAQFVEQNDMKMGMIRGPDGWKNSSLHIVNEPRVKKYVYHYFRLCYGNNFCTITVLWYYYRLYCSNVEVKGSPKTWSDWLLVSKKLIKKGTPIVYTDLEWIQYEADKLEKNLPRPKGSSGMNSIVASE